MITPVVVGIERWRVRFARSPSSNSFVPEPRTIGWICRMYRSTRPAACSDLTSSPEPSSDTYACAPSGENASADESPSQPLELAGGQLGLALTTRSDNRPFWRVPLGANIPPGTGTPRAAYSYISPRLAVVGIFGGSSTSPLGKSSV